MNFSSVAIDKKPLLRSDFQKDRQVWCCNDLRHMGVFETTGTPRSAAADDLSKPNGT
jgi:hypothetical protein